MLSSVIPQFNLAPAENNVRHPRAIILVNGMNVIWQTIELTTTTFYMSDHFHIELPQSGQPPLFTLNYLMVTAPIEVKIYIGFPNNPSAYTQNDLELLFQGNIDKLDIDPLRRTITMSGRDLTSKFIDTKTYEKLPNQTSSSIVSSLATQQGLTPVVTETKTLAGTFFAYENTLLTKETTQWDLMCFLAQQEGFVIYVMGNNLIFKPRPTTSQTPYILRYTAPGIGGGSPQFNGMDLHLSRSLTLAQDVQVKVRVPFSPATGKAFTVLATASHKNAATVGFQTYTYTYAGLSKQQALAKAQQIASDITLHEILLKAELPGDNLLRKDSLIQLVGLDPSVNQLYYADNVIRRLSLSEGYHMSIQAKNHSPDSQVSI